MSSSYNASYNYIFIIFFPVSVSVRRCVVFYIIVLFILLDQL